jgi:hypothetical protein
MLGAHPKIRSFPETHFFDRLFGLGLRVTCRETPKGWYRMASMFVSDAVTAAGFARPSRSTSAWKILRELPECRDLKIPYGALRLGTHVKTFSNTLDMLTLRSKGQIWIEKTPDHLHYIRYILKYIPDAKFIHLIRRGVDTVASLYDAAQKYPSVWDEVSSIEGAIKRWNIALEGSLQFRENPAHHFVCYEELVSEPEKILRDVCRFLGCDYTNDMIRCYGNAAEKLVQSNEPWKNGNFTGIRVTSDTKFLELFNDVQRQYIQDNIIEWPE